MAGLGHTREFLFPPPKFATAVEARIAKRGRDFKGDGPMPPPAVRFGPGHVAGNPVTSVALLDAGTGLRQNPLPFEKTGIQGS